MSSTFGELLPACHVLSVKNDEVLCRYLYAFQHRRVQHLEHPAAGARALRGQAVHGIEGIQPVDAERVGPRREEQEQEERRTHRKAEEADEGDERREGEGVRLRIRHQFRVRRQQGKQRSAVQGEAEGVIQERCRRLGKEGPQRPLREVFHLQRLQRGRGDGCAGKGALRRIYGGERGAGGVSGCAGGVVKSVRGGGAVQYGDSASQHVAVTIWLPGRGTLGLLQQYQKSDQ